MSEIIGLLSCPFCGGMKIRVGKRMIESEKLYNVHCFDCFGETGYYFDKLEAAVAWNRLMDIRWTTEPPTKSGWYVCCNMHSSDVKVAWIFEKDDELWAAVNGAAPERLSNWTDAYYWLRIRFPVVLDKM